MKKKSRRKKDALGGLKAETRRLLAWAEKALPLNSSEDRQHIVAALRLGQQHREMWIVRYRLIERYNQLYEKTLQSLKRLRDETPEFCSGLIKAHEIRHLRVMLEELRSETSIPPRRSWTRRQISAYRIALRRNLPGGKREVFIVEDAMPLKVRLSLLAWETRRRVRERLAAVGVPEANWEKLCRDALKAAGLRERFDPTWAGVVSDEQGTELLNQPTWLSTAGLGRQERGAPDTREDLRRFRRYFEGKWRLVIAIRSDGGDPWPSIATDLGPILKRWLGRSLTSLEEDELRRVLRNNATTARSFAVHCVRLKDPRSLSTLRRLARMTT